MFRKSPPVVRCAEVDQPVCLNQTEEQCRAQHECQQPNCPLGADFQSSRLDDLLTSLKRA